MQKKRSKPSPSPEQLELPTENAADTENRQARDTEKASADQVLWMPH